MERAVEPFKLELQESIGTVLRKPKPWIKALIVVDDIYDEVSQSKKLLNLVISGQHRNLGLLDLKHNVYRKTKPSKTIDLNRTHLKLFNNPRDVEQIGMLGRQ